MDLKKWQLLVTYTCISSFEIDAIGQKISFYCKFSPKSTLFLSLTLSKVLFRVLFWRAGTAHTISIQTRPQIPEQDCLLSLFKIILSISLQLIMRDFCCLGLPVNHNINDLYLRRRFTKSLLYDVAYGRNTFLIGQCAQLIYQGPGLSPKFSVKMAIASVLICISTIRNGLRLLL